RTRMRLVEGESRIRLVRAQSARPQRLWRHGHGRQPRRAADAAGPAASPGLRLIAAAAQRWNVPEAECEAANSKVLHKMSGRSLDYGTLAAEAGKIKLAKEPVIRSPDQFKLIGKSLPRLDTPLKINGSAKFAIDTQIPGMVYAAISACPVFGGKLKSVDEAPATGRRGVQQVVKLDNAVAVVADRFWRAKEALVLLKPEWETGEAGKTDSAQLAKLYRDTPDG